MRIWTISANFVEKKSNMKNVVYKYGLIAGGIQVIVGFGLMALLVKDGSSKAEYGELLGYTTMIVALSLIFFGIKAYRDEQLGGVITFGKAVQVGILITLVASVIYVAGWLLYYHLGSGQEMMDSYLEQQIANIQNSGRPEAVIQQEISEMQSFMELYEEQPLVMIGLTFLEIFPVGLIISLIAAVLLRKKEGQMAAAAEA
ncbi:DUF4199 domain-containing protein [Flavilitoribacter nigricans DSM 23189 = NBRC 102662]|uniref:DUF4199 domain-containing protein n=2 Tax=Flavilitoribacter TaxID=2762562 RepID=A0A2D0N5T7_FLAN2|nr:DUF4199 domain-containing protein [Flavilitoribacter nigricans DSM 23189 = NBRC 102662]